MDEFENEHFRFERDERHHDGYIITANKEITVHVTEIYDHVKGYCLNVEMGNICSFIIAIDMFDPHRVNEGSITMAAGAGAKIFTENPDVLIRAID